MHFTQSTKPWSEGLLSILFIFLMGCAANAPTSGNTHTDPEKSDTTDESKDPVYSIYLLGDAGGASLKPREPVLNALQKQLAKSGKQSAVIFLGDNVYPDGLPPESADGHKQAEKRLKAQLKTVEDHPGRVIFIPGNHDWKSSGGEGDRWIRRQERHIESYLQRGNTFLPDSGYPGPATLELGNQSLNQSAPFNIRLLILDTQWWLHKHEKPLYPGVENVQQQKKQILAKVGKILRKNRDDEILVAGHHPLFSYGRHGGYFPLKAHLLPPIFGSMYVGYRNIWGYPHDIPSYKSLKEGLLSHFVEHDQLIYASGHDHSLQYIPRQQRSNKQFYLISGAASRTSYVKDNPPSSFTNSEKGFMAIHYLKDRTKQIVIWNQNGKVIFQKVIPPAPQPTP